MTRRAPRACASGTPRASRAAKSRARALASAVHAAPGVKTLVALLLLAAPAALPSPLLADERVPDTRPVARRTPLTERVDAGDRVFARLLFGGRVMILAREGSRLSITELAGASTIEVERGRVVITVDRANLHPEDLIEVRTPHALATMPDGTLVVEVAEGSTFAPAGRPLEVFRRDPVSGGALEPPVVAAPNALVTVEQPRRGDVLANR